jgi:hypothetical protein
LWQPYAGADCLLTEPAGTTGVSKLFIDRAHLSVMAYAKKKVYAITDILKSDACSPLAHIRETRLSYTLVLDLLGEHGKGARPVLSQSYSMASGVLLP